MISIAISTHYYYCYYGRKAFNALLENLGGEAMKQLFCKSEERVVDMLAGLMDASAFTAKVLDECQQILATLAESWARGIEAASAELSSWCPSWQTARGKLMDKENIKLVLAMVKNEHYPKLAEASGKLKEMVSLAKAVHKEPGSPMVSAEVLRAASTSVSTAVETVVVTSALFRVRVELPRVKNVHAVRKAVAEIWALVAEKNVSVGYDVLAALDAHEQAEPKASETES